MIPIRRFFVLLGLSLVACDGGPATELLTDGVDAAQPIDFAPAQSPDAAPLKDWCQPTDPRSPPVAVFPTPEAGEAPYVDALNRARRSIRVMVYQMGQGGILDALIAKAKAGLSIKVILDLSEQPTNQKYFDQLK